MTTAIYTGVFSNNDYDQLIAKRAERKAIKEARKMLQQYRDSIDYSVFDSIAIGRYETCIAEINKLNEILYSR